MFVRLVALECIKTKGETEEEPYLCVYIGDDLYGHLGPWDMRRGDTEWLNFTFEGSTIRIILRERDPGVFKDEHYGGVELTDGCEVECDEHGRSVFTLPPEGTTRYKLYLDSRADNDNWRVSHHCLELLSLHCHDAQEKSDSVYIKVNGATVWGPQEMETGDIHRFRDMDPFSIPQRHGDSIMGRR